MARLKLGRWLVIGLMTSSGVAACGGRGNLPLSGGSTDDPDIDEPFGGTAGVGGSHAGSSFGGVSVGGISQSFGGTVVTSGTGPIGGTFPVAGTAAGGAASVCVAGDSFCNGNSLTSCNRLGTALTTKPCGNAARCVELGGVATCQKQVCSPGSITCDATARFVQVCAADGSSALNKQDCGAMGQACSGGMCVPRKCQPDQLFCGPGGVYQCSHDGLTSKLAQTCGATQFCQAGKCLNGVCSPNELGCNGDIVALCKADGSGFFNGGISCAKDQLRECQDGACQCAAGLSDCDMVLKNGCEVNSSSDPKNCGGCGQACSANHMARVTCNNSQCDGVCRGTFQDCNGDKLTDGCETDTAANLANCGGCGLACSANHVTPSCSKSVCDGACTGSFVDCNNDKQKDGCESDPAVDALNCGVCGVVCSRNHVKAACAAGVCSGACAAGFADCNMDKQKDGCEINTQTDEANCGKCGNPCAKGETCVAGKCSTLLTFTGIKQNLPVSSLTGWTQCFADTYDQGGATPVTTALAACKGSLLMMACRPKGSSTLQLAAYAKRADVLFDVGTSATAVHAANGVNWYFSDSWSWGFAPVGDVVNRNSCDVEDISGFGGGVGGAASGHEDGNLRMCWHTSASSLQTGFRCGYDQLNGSPNFERLLFTAQ